MSSARKSAGRESLRTSSSNSALASTVASHIHYESVSLQSGTGGGGAEVSRLKLALFSAPTEKTLGPMLEHRGR